MNKLFWQTAKLAPVLFAASLFTATGVGAETITADKEAVSDTLEQINNYQELEQGTQSQVTNVNQLRDVSPTDWAYEALRSLVDRYGCISGFPNQTYRGNQPLSRYEFAAGLNSCLNQIERLIASQEGTGQEDLDTINRLTQEFEAELATIGGRVDEIESRTAVLEDSQFSTTTKLKGEAIFGLSNIYGGGINSVASGENALIGVDGLEEESDINDEFIEANVGDLDGNGDFDDDDIALNFVASQNGGVADFNGDGEINDDDIGDFEDESEIDAETTFSSRVRLNFDTSFTGKDRLRARLEGGNFDSLGDIPGSTSSARLGYDTDTDFNIELSDLHYRFPVGERITAWVGPFGLDLDDIFAVSNPMLESSGSGALSRFSRRNPVLYRGTESAGAGVNLDLIPDRVGINFGYLTDDAENPAENEGLFGDSSFSGGAQLVLSPIEALEINATYIRNFQTGDSVNQSGSTVDGNATQPFGEINTGANKFGLGANLNVGEKIVLAGFGGYADVTGFVEGDDNDPSGEIWTWGANLSFLDLVKEGSQLSFAGGMLPKFVSDIGEAEIAAGVQEDRDTSYLVEALYRFPLNDNIHITPGVYAIFNPNHVDTNDTIVVGAIRTTFEF